MGAEQTTARGKGIAVPSALPRLAPEHALAVVTLPLHVNWSQPGRRFDLGQRRERARVYEIVLREGTLDDVLAYVDGLLLIDLWDELVLPADVRAAWQELVAPPETAAGS